MEKHCTHPKIGKEFTDPGRRTSYAQHPGMTTDGDAGWVTISVLPDDALLDIFDFYLPEY
jgi:hypothetical protein